MNLSPEPLTNCGAPKRDHEAIAAMHRSEDIATLKARVAKLEQTLAQITPKLERVFRIAGAE